MAVIDPRIMSLAVLQVRRFLKDHKHKNRLLLNEFESEDEEVRQAIVDALADWNIALPPLPAVTLSTHPAKHLLVRKAAMELLRSAMIWHAREHLPSSDGGTSADDHAKFGEYSQIIGMNLADYEKKRDDLKVSINISRAYGGLGSEYAYDFYDWEYGLTSVVDTSSGNNTQGEQR